MPRAPRLLQAVPPQAASVLAPLVLAAISAVGVAVVLLLWFGALAAGHAVMPGSLLLHRQLFVLGFCNFAYNIASQLVLANVPVVAHGMLELLKRVFVVVAAALLLHDVQWQAHHILGALLATAGSLMYFHFTAKAYKYDYEDAVIMPTSPFKRDHKDLAAVAPITAAGMVAAFSSGKAAEYFCRHSSGGGGADGKDSRSGGTPGAADGGEGGLAAAAERDRNTPSKDWERSQPSRYSVRVAYTLIATVLLLSPVPLLLGGGPGQLRQRTERVFVAGKDQRGLAPFLRKVRRAHFGGAVCMPSQGSVDGFAASLATTAIQAAAANHLPAGASRATVAQRVAAAAKRVASSAARTLLQSDAKWKHWDLETDLDRDLYKDLDLTVKKVGKKQVRRGGPGAGLIDDEGLGDIWEKAAIVLGKHGQSVKPLNGRYEDTEVETAGPQQQLDELAAALAAQMARGAQTGSPSFMGAYAGWLGRDNVGDEIIWDTFLDLLTLTVMELTDNLTQVGGAGVLVGGGQ